MLYRSLRRNSRDSAEVHVHLAWPAHGYGAAFPKRAAVIGRERQRIEISAADIAVISTSGLDLVGPLARARHVQRRAEAVTENGSPL